MLLILAVGYTLSAVAIQTLQARRVRVPVRRTADEHPIDDAR